MFDPPYDPFKDDISFLIATYIMEDVGVSGYLVCAVTLATTLIPTPTVALTLTLHHGGRPRVRLPGALPHLSVHVSLPLTASLPCRSLDQHLALTLTDTLSHAHNCIPSCPRLTHCAMEFHTVTSFCIR